MFTVTHNEMFDAIRRKTYVRTHHFTLYTTVETVNIRILEEEIHVYHLNGLVVFAFMKFFFEPLVYGSLYFSLSLLSMEVFL